VAKAKTTDRSLKRRTKTVLFFLRTTKITFYVLYLTDMDREVIIYIIFAIIYFVIRNLKKKPQVPDVQDEPAPRAGEHRTAPQPQQAPPVTFEDLLRELTGEKKTETPVPAFPKPKGSFEFPSDGTNYEDVHEEWEDKKVATIKEGSTTRLFSDEDSKRIYQQAQKIAVPESNDFDQQLKMAKSRFAEFEIKEDTSHLFREELVEMLTTSEGAKKAIILSEILNRKY